MIRNNNSLHDMVIPDGMTQKEELVYKFTGKFPKSVTDRWQELHGNEVNNIHSGDEIVHVDSQILGDSGYTTESGMNYAGGKDAEEEGFFSKIINHIFED